MPTRRKKVAWSIHDTEASLELEMPLLLALNRTEPQTLKALRGQIGHPEAAIERALRHLASRGLCHRRETVSPARFYRMANERDEAGVIPETVIRRWILSERGKVWRDRQIAAGKLATLPEQYAKVAEPWRIRAEQMAGLEREVANA